MKPPPCPHDAVTRIRPAQTVYGTPGITYARYLCNDCGCEWDNPSERPTKDRPVYRVKFDDSQTTVVRNGEHLGHVISFKAEADMDSPQRVTLVEYAQVEPYE